MDVQSAATTRASRNRIGACTRGPAPGAGLAVRVDRGRHLFIPPLAPSDYHSFRWMQNTLT